MENLILRWKLQNTIAVNSLFDGELAETSALFNNCCFVPKFTFTGQVSSTINIESLRPLAISLGEHFRREFQLERDSPQIQVWIGKTLENMQDITQ